MVKLELEFVGLKSLEGYVTVDGKYVKLKKVKGKYFCNLETNQEKSEVIIYKSHEYTSKHWFLWNAFCFLISLFGLFDTSFNKKCLVQDVRFTISTMQDTRAVIRRQNFVDGGAMVNVETSAAIGMITNQQYYDKAAKKKHSIMNKAKIALAAVVVLAVTLLLI